MAGVLLLEPNAVLAQQYKAALEGIASVSVHADAQSAILEADTRTPALVIVEPLLASHSGVEFIYEFRSYGEWRHVPLVILSRLTAAELGLNQENLNELNILKAFYKPDTDLKTVAAFVRDTITETAT